MAFRQRDWQRALPTWNEARLVLLAGLLGGLSLLKLLDDEASFGPTRTAVTPPGDLTCSRPRVIDGDTINCGSRRVRLAGIDAPEMPGHCRPGRQCTPGDPDASRRHLDRLVVAPLSCTTVDTDVYGRTVARCTTARGIDLSCAMIDSGHAVARYGPLYC